MGATFEQRLHAVAALTHHFPDSPGMDHVTTGDFLNTCRIRKATLKGRIILQVVLLPFKVAGARPNLFAIGSFRPNLDLTRYY